MKPRGFTLIELLVVIAIIAILASILFPVFTSAKETAKKTQCLSNMKQITTACLMYLGDYDTKFPTSVGSGLAYGDGDWGKDYWMFHFKPYVTQRAANIQGKKGNVYECPSNTVLHVLDWSYAEPQPGGFGLPIDYAETAWGLVRSEDGYYRYYCSYAINEHVADDWIKPAMWKDPANSFLFLEANKSELEGDEIAKFESYGIIGYNYPHRGTSNFAFIDGHVKSHKASYRNNDPRVNWHWLYPPAGEGDVDDCGPWTARTNDDDRCPRY